MQSNGDNGKCKAVLSFLTRKEHCEHKILEADANEQLTMIFCLWKQEQERLKNIISKSYPSSSIWKKPHDSTWRHDILIDLNEAGIEGRMIKCIQNFIKPRSFKFKVIEIRIDTRIQIVGLLLGTIVSATFLILKTKQKRSSVAE